MKTWCRRVRYWRNFCPYVKCVCTVLAKIGARKWHLKYSREFRRNKTGWRRGLLRILVGFCLVGICWPCKWWRWRWWCCEKGAGEQTGPVQGWRSTDRVITPCSTANALGTNTTTGKNTQMHPDKNLSKVQLPGIPCHSKRSHVKYDSARWRYFLNSKKWRW